MSIDGPNEPLHEGAIPYPPPAQQWQQAPPPWSGHFPQQFGIPGNGGQYGSPAPFNGAPYAHPGPYGDQYRDPTLRAPSAVVAAETPGVAVLLTFLWLGAGHLYAGRTGAGVAFMVANSFLLLLLVIPIIGWLMAPVSWVALFVMAAVTASGAVKAHNARWGIVGL